MKLSLFEYEQRKRSSSNKVLEDELTSRVFGILKLIDHRVISKWLKINGLENIEFWPKYDNFEPDVVITDTAGEKLIIECKKDDFGTIKQIAEEYTFAKQKVHGRFLFLTANISRPELLNKTERFLNLKKGTIEWRNWTSLFSILCKIIDEYSVDNISKNFAIELMNYLRWLRMSYELGELMEKYNDIYKQGWLEILGEKFDEFMKELRRSFADQLDSDNSQRKYEKIRVSSDVKRNLFDASWINFYSDDVENINDKLYYYLLFNMSTFDWIVVLGGKNKETRSKILSILKKNKDHGFCDYQEPSGSGWIAGCSIAKEPDFNEIDSLKEKLVNGTLESIHKMDMFLKTNEKSS